MANALDNVLATLRTRLLSIGTLPALRYHENILDAPPTNADAWVSDVIQLGTKTPMTLAAVGSSQWWQWDGGMYKITLHYPPNTTMHVPLSLAGIVTAAFDSSSMLTSDGEPVRVLSTRIAAGVSDAAGVSVPIEIRFQFEQYS